MNKPNILMFHRILLSNEQKIDNLYFQRNMVNSTKYLYKIIENYLKKGFYFGSIENCLNNKKYFHLSFDDGFSEHLQVANLLNNKFPVSYNSISFSINVGNSIFQNYTGMDIVYQIISNDKIKKLERFLNVRLDKYNIPNIKNKISNLSMEELKELSNYFSEFDDILKQTYLSKKEIIELSQLFKITSHSITHRFLTSHKNDSKKEILLSKNILENLVNKPIDTFCYPEGKNNNELQDYCEKVGYKYALSIRHEPENYFCIGRKII